MATIGKLVAPCNLRTSDQASAFELPSDISITTGNSELSSFLVSKMPCITLIPLTNFCPLVDKYCVEVHTSNLVRNI